jgi:hypothetical protein
MIQLRIAPAAGGELGMRNRERQYLLKYIY